MSENSTPSGGQRGRSWRDESNDIVRTFNGPGKKWGIGVTLILAAGFVWMLVSDIIAAGGGA